MRRGLAEACVGNGRVGRIGCGCRGIHQTQPDRLHPQRADVEGLVVIPQPLLLDRAGIDAKAERRGRCPLDHLFDAAGDGVVDRHLQQLSRSQAVEADAEAILTGHQVGQRALVALAINDHRQGVHAHALFIVIAGEFGLDEKVIGRVDMRFSLRTGRCAEGNDHFFNARFFLHVDRQPFGAAVAGEPEAAGIAAVAFDQRGLHHGIDGHVRRRQAVDEDAGAPLRAGCKAARPTAGGEAAVFSAPSYTPAQIVPARCRPPAFASLARPRRTRRWFGRAHKRSRAEA